MTLPPMARRVGKPRSVGVVPQGPLVSRQGAVPPFRIAILISHNNEPLGLELQHGAEGTWGRGKYLGLSYSPPYNPPIL